MISELEIRNFRSIRNDKITLEPLTVLIGANGSGKSNLVKALEFISDIPRSGVHLAVSKQGGRDGMVSKDIPLKDIGKYPTYIKFRSCLVPPNMEIDHPKSVDVTYEFELAFKNSGRIQILSEKLVFYKVLYVGKVLSDKNQSPIIEHGSPEHHESDSSFSVSHKGYLPINSTNPPINEATLNSYVYWLGLDALRNKFTTPKELHDFLQTFRTKRSRRLVGKGKRRDASTYAKGLFIDPNFPTVLDFAPQARFFISSIESIKRYDLLLHELRREQAPSDSPALTKAGENMPAALRRLSSNKEAYNRLNASFKAIAPHIIDMKASSLRTGKEFVEFVESKSGRGIESWESSDGSLRALAILVALETSDNGDTVIIEEPEQNLHPWAIRTLIDHMREVVEKKNVQIIITTHSEHVLERVEAQEVRVVTRLPSKGTKFKRIDQIVLNKKIEMGEVGRLWVKGMLGGVPTVQ